MANLDVRTPRFYVDYINYLANRDNFGGHYKIETSGSTGEQIDVATGSNIANLYDMRPLNQVEFNTTGNTDGHVNLWFDLKSQSFKIDFVAILNHNMMAADAKVRISSSDGRDTNDDGNINVLGSTYVSSVNHHHSSSGTNGTGAIMSRVIGVDTDTPTGTQQVGIINNIASTDTSTNGWGAGHTIIKLNETSDRFWGIQFEGTNSQTSLAHGDGTFDTSTNLKIGCIMLGQYYDMPQAPDLQIKRSIVFDGVNVQQSIGGSRFSTLSNHGRRSLTSTNKSPFTTHYNSFGNYGGRMIYDMNFSYLNSSNIMPTKYDTNQNTDEAVVEDLWNKTNGRHTPFIFTQDNSSSDYSDFMFARFGQDNLDMTQVADKVYNIKFRIEEEF